MNKSLEAEEWEKEQKFIVVAFFLGIPLVAGCFLFFRFINPGGNTFSDLIFHSWETFLLSSIVGG